MSPRKSRYAGNGLITLNSAVISHALIPADPMATGGGCPSQPVLVTPGIRHFFLGNVAVDPQPILGQTKFASDCKWQLVFFRFSPNGSINVALAS